MEVNKSEVYVAPALEVTEVIVEVGFNGSIWLEDGTGAGSGDVITPVM